MNEQKTKNNAMCNGLRTINGKTLDVVERELCAKLPARAYGLKDGKYPFPRTKYMRVRLNEVVGIFNYDFKVSEPQLVEVEGKVAFKSLAQITLKYDDGTVCTIKEGVGVYNINYLKTGEIANIASDMKCSCSMAMKACMEALRIGFEGLSELDMYDTEETESWHDSKEETDLSGLGRNVSELPVEFSKDVADELALYRVRIVGKVTPRGTKGYGVPVELESGARMTLILWKDRMTTQGINENAFVTKLVEGTTLSLYGTLGMAQGEQQLCFSKMAG